MADFPHEIFGQCRTNGARALVALLWTYASHEEQAPFVFPNNQTLSEIMSQDVRSIRRHLNELRDLGLIEEKRRRMTHGFVRGFVLNRGPVADAAVRETDAAVRETDAAVRETDAAVRETDAAVHVENDERTQLSAKRTQLSGSETTQEDAAVRASGRSCPGKRTQLSGKADAAVLIIPIEAPIESPIEAAAENTVPLVEQSRGRAAAGTNEIPKRREPARGLTDMLDQAAAREPPAPTEDPTDAVITGIRANRWDTLKGAELGAGVGVKIAQTLWRHMCVRMGKPNAPFSLGARTLWTQATSPDFAGTPVTPSVMLLAIEARTVHERRKAQTGGRPAESMPRLWGWILEEPDKWANPKSGMSGEKLRRHEHDERVARVQAVKDRHRAELDAIGDQAERVHREQCLLHEAGLLTAKPLSVAFLRESLGVPKAVST